MIIQGKILNLELIDDIFICSSTKGQPQVQMGFQAHERSIDYTHIPSV